MVYFHIDSPLETTKSDHGYCTDLGGYYYSHTTLLQFPFKINVEGIMFSDLIIESKFAYNLKVPKEPPKDKFMELGSGLRILTRKARKLPPRKKIQVMYPADGFGWVLHDGSTNGLWKYLEIIELNEGHDLLEEHIRTVHRYRNLYEHIAMAEFQNLNIHAILSQEGDELL